MQRELSPLLPPPGGKRVGMMGRGKPGTFMECSFLP